MFVFIYVLSEEIAKVGSARIEYFHSDKKCHRPDL